MASTLVPHYLGGGLLSARPATLDLQPGCVGFYVASDAGISVWQGGVWRQIDSIGALAITLPDTSYTLTSAEYQGIGRLNLAGTLTAARDTVFPAAFTAMLVTNATSQTLTLKKAGQTGTAVAAGVTVLVFSGAADVVVFAGGGGGGGGAVTSVNGATGAVVLTIAGLTSTQTVTSAATVTPVATNDKVVISAQAAGLTIANPSGTAAEGQGFVIALYSAAAQTITFGADYRGFDAALPTTTVAGKWMYLPVMRNHTDSKWDVLKPSVQI